MTSDSVVQIVRYAMLMLGGGLTMLGWATSSEVATLTTNVMAAVGPVMAVGTTVWGLYVKWQTKSVPVATAARADVPTINPVTGAHQPGDIFQG